MTAFRHMTREQARRKGLEGFWELHQMEKKETDNINDLLEKQESDDDRENNS